MPVEVLDRGLHCLILYHRPLDELAKLTGKDPMPLLCAGTRYLVEHQLDWLCDQGFKQIRLALNDRSRPTEDLVGGGERWGCQVTYAYDPHNLDPRLRLRKHQTFVGEGMLLLEGNAIVRASLPPDLVETTIFTHAGQVLPMLFCAGADWERIVSEASDEDLSTITRLCDWAATRLAARRIDIDDVFYFELDDLPAFMEMNRAMLQQPDEFHFRGHVLVEGVRRGRRVSIADAVSLDAPVIIGDDTIVKGEAQLGPNVVIGNNSFIERGACIRNSVIAPSTYVGRRTQFDGKYVCRNYVVDLESKVGIFIDDPLILGDLTRSIGIVDLVERGLALALLLGLLPILLLLLPIHRLLKGCWLVSEQILVQPVPRNLKNGYDMQWTTWQRFRFGLFLFDFIPSLGDIVTGKLKFVGNPPLVDSDLERLEGPFMGDLLRGKAGLTGPVQQMGESTSPEEIFAATIYYNATQSPWGDVKYFLRSLVPGVHRFSRN